MTETEVVAFVATARIRLGEKTFLLNGGGRLNEAAGVVEGSYKHNIPANDADPHILQTVLVTGYPSICRTPAKENNPFQKRNYSYRRHIDLGCHGWLCYHAACWLVPAAGGLCLESDFEVSGSLELPELCGANPITELWSPVGTHIQGAFAIVWPRADGQGNVEGHATTTYEPAVTAPRLLEKKLRHIEFTHIHVQEQGLEIVQESWMADLSSP